MPHNDQLVPKKHAYKIRFDEVPLTRFKDYRSSIRVELLDPEPKEQMMKRLYQFVKATWADDPSENENPTHEQMSEAINAMLSGKALGLGLEATNLTFKISGITRIDTHQIVRQRVGVVFSQQCTGDRFLHHNDVLVEECIAQDPRLLREFISATLKAKYTYYDMIRSRLVSIQAARSILPHNLETFILMNTNLSTFLFFHQKRIDDGSQTWQMNLIAQKMADEIIKTYPETKNVFDQNRTKFKFQVEASKDRKNTFSTSLYLPDPDTFEYHEEDFLYRETKSQMHFTDIPIDDQYYYGYNAISKEMYDEIKQKYETESIN